MNKFSQFLENKLIEWQYEIKAKKSLRDFADYLGVTPQLLSMWMNGARKPGYENINKLAEVLGIEVYDSLDIPRPNPVVYKLQSNFDRIPEGVIQQISDLIEPYNHALPARKQTPTTENSG